MNGYDIAQNMERQDDGVPLSNENPTGKSFKVTSSTKFDKGYKQAQQAPQSSTGARPQEEQVVEQAPQQQVQNPYQPSSQSFSNSPYFQSNRLSVPSYQDYVNARRQVSQQQFAAQPQQNGYAQQQQMPQQQGQLVPVDLNEDQQMLLEIKESEFEWALKKAVIPEIDKKYDELFQQEVKKLKGVEYDKITGNAETKDMQARQQYNALVEEFAQRKQAEIDAKTAEAEQRLTMIEQRVATGQPVDAQTQPQQVQRQPVQAPGTKTVTFSNGKTVTFHSKPKTQQPIRSEVAMRQSPSLGWGKPAPHKPAVSFGFGNGKAPARRTAQPYSFNMNNNHLKSKKPLSNVKAAQQVRPFTFQTVQSHKPAKFKFGFNWGGKRK